MSLNSNREASRGEEGKESITRTRTMEERFLATVIILVAMTLTGCVTKSKAKADAREAFIAGQQQAMAMARLQQAQGPTVTVVGQGRNKIIPWTQDLTLAQAIVNAGYFGT